jgi:hypothetical protein
LAAVDLNVLKSYEKLRDRLREAKRLLKILTQQAEDQRLVNWLPICPTCFRDSGIGQNQSQSNPARSDCGEGAGRGTVSLVYLPDPGQSLFGGKL